MENAIDYDIKGEYILAAGLYEKEIKSSTNLSVDNFINLAFLYWSFASRQNDFNRQHNIPDSWSIVGGENFQKILNMGLVIHPENIELQFWNRYFPYRLFQTEFSELDCKALIKKYANQNNDVPYFFLHLFDKNQYKSEILILRSLCDRYPTAKHRYIKSFLDCN